MTLVVLLILKAMQKNKILIALVVLIIVSWLWGIYLFQRNFSNVEEAPVLQNEIQNSKPTQIENRLLELKSLYPTVETKIRWDIASGRITWSFAVGVINRLISKASFSPEIEQFIINDSLSWTGSIGSVAYKIAPELSVYAGLKVDECRSYYESIFGPGNELESHTRLCQNAVLLVDFLWDTKKVSLTEREKAIISRQDSLYQQIISARKGESFECVDSIELLCDFLLKGKAILSLESLSARELELAPGLSYINMWPLWFFKDLTALSLEQKVTLFAEYTTLYKLFYTGDSAICQTLTTAPLLKICNDWANNRESQKIFYKALLGEYVLSLYVRHYGKS
jgi:hypothetical protein